jgi:hypothetical protein
LTHFARWVALGVAGWLARRCGYECVPRTEIVEARRVCADLCRYVRRSGHLTRAYHDGRKQGAAFPEEARLLFMRQGTNDGAEVDLTSPGQLVEIRDMLNEAIQEFGL